MNNFTHVRRNLKTNTGGEIRTQAWLYIALQAATHSTITNLPSVSKGNAPTHKVDETWDTSSAY